MFCEKKVGFYVISEPSQQILERNPWRLLQSIQLNQSGRHTNSWASVNFVFKQYFVPLHSTLQ